MSAPLKFLRHLWPELPAAAWLLVYTLPDKTSHWCSSVEEAARTATMQQGRDVYLGMGTSGHDNGPFARASRNEITAIPGLWVDLDCKADTRKKSALPSTLDQLLTIIPDDTPPTLLVATGGGYHAYWLFDEPMLLPDAAARQKAESLLKDWQTFLRRRAATHGWTLDYTADLPRILRIPGTANHKDPAAPRLVTITRDNGPRWDPAELREILDDCEFVDRETGTSHADDHGDGWKAIPIRVSATASVDADLIAQLCQIDPRFRLTWNHDRPDIIGPDGGFSEYDLAIANFCVAAGLDHQTTVDMMIEHRRLHGGKQKLRPQYYQRTLWRAMHQTGNHRAPGHIADDKTPAPEASIAADGPPPEQPNKTNDLGGEEGQKQHNPPPPNPNSRPAADAPPPRDYFDPQTDFRATSDAMRVKLLEQVSQWIGMRILRVIKVTGREPSYVIETDTVKIDVESAARLIDQGHMRARIAATTNLLVRRYKPDEWDRLIRMMIGAVTEKDGGAELEVEGEITTILQQYLTSRGFATRGASHTQLRSPMITDAGDITVNTIDIQQYLRREFDDRRTVRQIAAALSAIGASSVRHRAAGIDQTRWKLPRHEWWPEVFGQETTHHEQTA